MPQLRNNRRCAPSPQSTRIRWLPASTRRPGWLRSADGTLAEVPRNVTANMIGAELSFGWRGCHDAGPKTYVPNEILPHFSVEKDRGHFLAARLRADRRVGRALFLAGTRPRKLQRATAGVRLRAPPRGHIV